MNCTDHIIAEVAHIIGGEGVEQGHLINAEVLDRIIIWINRLNKNSMHNHAPHATCMSV